MFFNIIQLIGGVILAGGYIPQIIQVLKTHSVEDLNESSFDVIFVGMAMVEVYAVHLAIKTPLGIAFCITNTLSLITSGMLCTLIFIYKKRK